MQDAEWLVYPSQIEAGPLTPLEVMACGTPVVALARAGTMEYVPSKLLARDVEGMAWIVHRNERPSPSLLRKWVRTAFTVKRQVDGFERILESVMDGARW
jgi:glycosyltransferase involved in cell wall biosynthesis